MKSRVLSPEGFCFALLLALSVFVAVACAGCKSAGTAVRLEQRRIVGVTSAEFGEYTIPVVSLGEGPSVSVYQTKDVPSTVVIAGVAATTNRTDILWGMYESEESKVLDFHGASGVGCTNCVPPSAVSNGVLQLTQSRQGGTVQATKKDDAAATVKCEDGSRGPQ